MAVIESLPSPVKPTSAHSPCIRNPKPDLVALLSQKDTLWRQVCKECGAGWPWAYFERNKEDGLRDFTQEICARCVDSKAEQSRWQDVANEMEAVIAAQRVALDLPSSPKFQTTLPTPASSSSSPAPISTSVPPANVSNGIPLSLSSIFTPITPIDTKSPNALPVTNGGPAATVALPPTPTSAAAASGPQLAMNDLPEPQRASWWLRQHYRTGHTYPYLTQMKVFREYQKRFAPYVINNGRANPVMAGTDFVQLVQATFPSVYLVPEGYAFGGLEEKPRESASPVLGGMPGREKSATAP